MSQRLVADALLVQKRDRGEADRVLTFFTRDLGTVSAVAYAAQRSKKRFAVLEPFHTLRIEVDDGARELAVLREAVVAVARPAFLGDLDRMQAGGEALSWVRAVCPPRAPEPEVWGAIVAFLDVAAVCPVDDLAEEQAAFGLRLLRIAGLIPPPSSVRAGMTAAQVRAVVNATLAEIKR